MNLVFDFGAVLFTWQPGELLRQTFPKRLLTAQAVAELAQQIFGHPDWHAFDAGLLETHEVISRTAQRLDLPHGELGDLVHGIGEHLVPIPDMVELLQGLLARRLAAEGVSGLYYLSNMPKPYARLLVQRHDFLQWFDGGIFSADVHHIKPEPAIYQLLQNRYNLNPAKTVFIDDLKGNVQAAQSLGWHGIHFESALQLQAALEAKVTACG